MSEMDISFRVWLKHTMLHKSHGKAYGFPANIKKHVCLQTGQKGWTWSKGSSSLIAEAT